jgi:hypothetical protein
MNAFWKEFGSTYPDPALQVRPTYVPRVNIPTYFSLTRDSSVIFKNDPQNPEELDSALYQQSFNLTMRGLVTQMKVDPGDGSPPFTCAMGVAKAGDDGYDETSDPFRQMSTCRHTYTRSSAHQPDGMYTVKLTIIWTVDYWKGGPNWNKVGTAEVHAVQRLPVQEVEAIGG